MKTYTYLVAAAFLLLSKNTRAQSCNASCLTDSISINTGYDFTNNAQITAGQADSNWQVTQLYTDANTPTAPGTTPFNAYVITPAAAWGAFPNGLSNWLSAYPTYTNNGSNWVNNHCDQGLPGTPSGVPYTFARGFYICDSTPVPVHIHLEIMADDLADTIKIDDVPTFVIGAESICDSGSSFEYMYRIRLDTDITFSPGNHNLSIDMVNMYGPSMGINVQGAIQTTDQSAAIVANNCNSANTGISTVTNSQGDIAILSDPMDNSFIIRSAKPVINQVSVYDMNGREIGMYNYDNEKQAIISAGNFAAGIYMIRVNNAVSGLVNKIK